MIFWNLFILIVLLCYSVSAKIENVQFNPSFTKITARVLPLEYSQDAIVSKRLLPSNYDNKMIVKRTTNPSSNDHQNERNHSPPPHAVSRNIGNTNRADNDRGKNLFLADELKNLSISQSHSTLHSPNQLHSTSSSANQLPPRSPNRSKITSPRSDGKFLSKKPGHSSHKPSNLSKTTQSSETSISQSSAQSRTGKHCTCAKIGGVCGC